MSAAQFYFTPAIAELSFLVVSETSPSQSQGLTVQALSSSGTTREVELSHISDEYDDLYGLESHKTCDDYLCSSIERVEKENMETLPNEFLANVEEDRLENVRIRLFGYNANLNVWRLT